MLTLFIKLYIMCRMTALKAFLDTSDISAKRFSEIVGSSEQAVYMWLRGERIPHDHFMNKITQATNGEVTPNDFYPLTHLKTKSKR